VEVIAAEVGCLARRTASDSDNDWLQPWCISMQARCVQGQSKPNLAGAVPDNCNRFPDFLPARARGR
jgi:hypothetical protein